LVPLSSLLLRPPPRSTLFPYTTLFRSAPVNTRFLSGVDPARQALQRRASQPIMETFMRRTADGSFRWVATQFPTIGSAQDAEMSDRKSTRLNSSHVKISYAVFCLKKKK